MTPSTPTVPTMSGQDLMPSIEPSSAPTAPMPGRSDKLMSNIEAASKDPRTGSQWATTSPSPGDPRYQYEEETQPFRPIYSLTETGLSSPSQPGIDYETYDPEPRPNSRHWLTSYSPSHWQRETALTWTAPPDERFNSFDYDYEMFGRLDDVAPWMQRVDRNIPYFSQPRYDLPAAPFPLPDSPNYHPYPNIPYAPHLRRV
ncbi:hypothetical protein ARMSODRAFT_1022759 [Armillaria solidipes]|uniref:Uncharacterized protein n=1 Tax=Armillaria solidipes TaxID=1076256 RepID=A0A2H3B500_9AGAR|nr:hypothetical protein ARMSODRAFT_1022759 [Armillaria solidipes]